MSDFENHPARNEVFFDEAASIAASQKLTEWMGVLLADHGEHVNRLDSGSRVLRLRNMDDGTKTMKARITAGSDSAFPELELTAPKDAHSDFITKVTKPALANRYYFIHTVVRDNRYGANKVESIDQPHPITAGEVNNMLTFAQLRPTPQEAPQARETKARSLGSFITRIFGRS